MNADDWIHPFSEVPDATAGRVDRPVRPGFAERLAQLIRPRRGSGRRTPSLNHLSDHLRRDIGWEETVFSVDRNHPESEIS